MSNIVFKWLLGSFPLVTTLIFSSSIYAAPHFTVKEQKVVDINLGIYAPFSNKNAFIGRNILAAMEMGSEQLHSARVHYSFYTLDERNSNLAEAARVLQKFIDVHHISVLVTDGSQSGLLAAPIAKKNHMIHFSMASDPSIADAHNNFLAWSPASEQARVLVNELKNKQIKQLGIISSDYVSDKVLAETVAKQLEKESTIQVSFNEQFKSGSTDFSPLMARIKQNIPDFYLIMASPQDIKLMQVSMDQAQVKKPFTSIVERVTPKVLEVFDGNWYVDTHDMEPDFIRKFQKSYINYPATEAGYAFDVFHILHQSVMMAIKTNRPFTTQEIASQIHALATGRGVMGPFNLDNKGVLYTQSTVKKVENGQLLTA